MTDAEIKSMARACRGGILDGRTSAGMCFAVCAALAGLLKMHGVAVELVDSDLHDDGRTYFANHFWLRLRDGRALDPTADQFRVKGRRLPQVYLGVPLFFHKMPAKKGAA